jgi:hypothetical protein
MMNVVIEHLGFVLVLQFFYANSWGSGVSKNLWWLIFFNGDLVLDSVGWQVQLVAIDIQAMLARGGIC